jgi:hypothetical protein
MAAIQLVVALRPRQVHGNPEPPMSILAHRSPDPLTRLADLLPRFAAQAATHDESDSSVAENYAALAAARLMSAGGADRARR